MGVDKRDKNGFDGREFVSSTFASASGCANERGNFFNLFAFVTTILHPFYCLARIRNSLSRGRTHIVRPSVSLSNSRWWRLLSIASVSDLRYISPLSISVYGSNKTGTTHSFCVEYSGGTGALVVVIGHQVLYPVLYREESAGVKREVKRYCIPRVSQRFYEDCPGFYYERNVG